MHPTSSMLQVRMNRVKKYLFAFVLSIWLLPPVIGEAQDAELGGFAFLRLEPSARASALGGRSSAALQGGDPFSLFYNPALMTSEVHRALSFSFLNHVGDVRAGFMAYGLDFGSAGIAGVGVRFLNWGKLQETDADGNEIGSFGATDVAWTAGYAYAYNPQLQFGVNLHAMLSTISSYRSTALAGDVGAAFFSLNGQFQASLTLQNVGVTLNSLGTLEDELPFDVRLSVAQRLQHVPILLTVTGYNLHDFSAAGPNATATDNIMQHVVVGTEFQFSERFNVRFGYNRRRHEALKTKSRLDFAGLGFGFGLVLSQVGFDYAYNSWSSFGGLHQFAVQVSL